MSHYCADHGWESDEARIACLDAENDRLITAVDRLRAERRDTLRCTDNTCDGPVMMRTLGVTCEAHKRSR